MLYLTVTTFKYIKKNSTFILKCKSWVEMWENIKEALIFQVSILVQINGEGFIKSSSSSELQSVFVGYLIFLNYSYRHVFILVIFYGFIWFYCNTGLIRSEELLLLKKETNTKKLHVLFNIFCSLHRPVFIFFQLVVLLKVYWFLKFLNFR